MVLMGHTCRLIWGPVIKRCIMFDHIQLAVPIGAAVLGTTLTALGALAAKRDQRLFEQQQQVPLPFT